MAASQPLCMDPLWRRCRELNNRVLSCPVGPVHSHASKDGTLPLPVEVVAGVRTLNKKTHRCKPGRESTGKQPIGGVVGGFLCPVSPVIECAASPSLGPIPRAFPFSLEE